MEESHDSNFRAIHRSHPFDAIMMTKEGAFSWPSLSNVVAPPMFTIATPKAVEKPQKRKYGQIEYNYQPFYVESCLVQLCEGERWLDTVQRCHYYAEEAQSYSHS